MTSLVQCKKKKHKALRTEAHKEAPAEFKCFFLYNGKTLKSISELADELMSMDDSVFLFHVTKEKNDFANWVRDVFGEAELAQKVAKSKTQQGMRKAIVHYFCE
jgi:hypothetical protein